MPAHFLTRHLLKIINAKHLPRNPPYTFFMQYIILTALELSRRARFCRNAVISGAFHDFFRLFWDRFTQLCSSSCARKTVWRHEYMLNKALYSYIFLRENNKMAKRVQSEGFILTSDRNSYILLEMRKNPKERQGDE